MTKEELEKEAEEYASMYARQYLHNDGSGLTNSYCEVYNAYYQSAEPREKQIQIDAEQIRALQKQNGELTDELTKKSDTNHQLVEQMAKLSEENAELTDELKALRESMKDYGAGCYENGLRNGKRKLEEQIEKMKCCKEEIIKALKETLDYEWLPAHNGKAKYLYLQTVIDIVNEKFEEINEK